MDHPDLDISMDNFELLARKYAPAIGAAAHKVHRRYQGKVALEDLKQEGLIALYDCIDKFDASRGVFFGLYLKVALKNRMECYACRLLPHFYKKRDGEPGFDRIAVDVKSIEGDLFNY